MHTDFAKQTTNRAGNSSMNFLRRASLICYKKSLASEDKFKCMFNIFQRKARRQLKEVSPSKESKKNQSRALMIHRRIKGALITCKCVTITVISEFLLVSCYKGYQVFTFDVIFSDLSRSLLDPELERIKDSNSHIINNLSQLQEQQKATHDTIARILEELVQSRKDQQDLQKIVEELFFNDPHDRKRKLEISHFESHKYAKGDEMSAIISSSSRRTRRHKDDDEGTDEEEGDAKLS
jgi:hypothetical protein